MDSQRQTALRAWRRQRGSQVVRNDPGLDTAGSHRDRCNRFVHGNGAEMSKRSVTPPAAGGRRNETKQLQMIDKRPTKTCANTWCGKRFEQPATGRPKVTCSDACKMVLYRERKKIEQERQLLAEIQNYNYTSIERHQAAWISWLMKLDSKGVKLNQKSATLIYTAMLEAGRIQPPSQRAIPHYLRQYLS